MIRIALLFFIFSIFTQASTAAAAQAAALDGDVLRTLSFGEIVRVEELGDARLMLYFENGRKGVFKPNVFGDADAEVAAFKISYELLSSGLVPPTVKRDIAPYLTLARTPPRVPTSIGSIQLYVEPATSSKSAAAPASLTQKSARDAFQFVFGQWDRNQTNAVVGSAGDLFLVNNAAIKYRQQSRFGENPFIHLIWLNEKSRHNNWSSKFPFENVVTLDHPKFADVLRVLGDKVDEQELRDIWAWIQLNPDTSCSLVTWDNRVWIQGRGFWKYPRLDVSYLPADLERAYRALTFEKLRARLSPHVFTNRWIEDALSRRDQLLQAVR